MNLHENKELFEELALLTKQWRQLPLEAVVKDYYIVDLLHNLQNSEFAAETIFKGGTSLSKCYNGVIQRFSEDIDLTFISSKELGSSARRKALEQMVNQISYGYSDKKTITKGDKNRTEEVHFNSDLIDNPELNKIKLEIGTVVNYGRSEALQAKSYIHEYLESINRKDIINEYNLQAVSLNVLPIEITFLEKLYAIKTQTYQNTIGRNARHIFDVTQLLKHQRIIDFLNNPPHFFEILSLVKEQTKAYSAKRNMEINYDLDGPYAFKDWKKSLNEQAKDGYNDLFKHMIYGGIQYSFDEAILAIEKLDIQLQELDANKNKAHLSLDYMLSKNEKIKNLQDCCSPTKNNDYER